MGLISGILGAGLSTIGNLVGNGISYNQQKQLAADQFNYNKQLMQMQMDFNKPSNQMLEYRKAGINPNAALGNNTSISSSSVGQGSAPNVGMLGSDMMQAFNQLYQADAQKQALEANAINALSQGKNNEADTIKKLSEKKNQDIQNDILSYQANDFKQKSALENNLIRSQIAETESKAVLNELLSTKQVAENANYQKIVDQDLAESVARIKLMQQEGRLNQAQAVDAMAGAILKKAQAVGVNISNKTANALSLDYIEKFGLDMKEQKERIKHTGKENDWYEWNHSIGSALNGLGLFISPSTFVGRSVVKGFK